MLGVFFAVSSKVAVDSILAGVGLGISLYNCSRLGKNAVKRKK